VFSQVRNAIIKCEIRVKKIYDIYDIYDRKYKYHHLSEIWAG